MDHEQMIALLREAERRAGSSAALARKIGVTRAYLCQIKSGAAGVSDRVLDALGLERKTIYFIKETTNG
jgi:DNA-binding transcriptional regulator YdaS (Cro superfamily)